MKIAKGEDERKLLAHNIESIQKNVFARLDAVDGAHNVQSKVFGNLETYSKEVMSELSDLKAVYKDQCDAFIERLSKLNHHLNNEVETLTRHCNAIDRTLADHEKRCCDNENTMETVLTKLTRCQEEILEAKHEIYKQEHNKVD